MIPEIAGTVPTTRLVPLQAPNTLRLMIPEIAGTVPFMPEVF